MTISNKHSTTGTIADDPAAEINKTEWNAEHTLTMATAKVLGRTTASTGSVEELAVVGPIALGTGTITTSMSTAKLLGRGTASTGVVEEITLGTNLSFSGTTLNASGGGGGGDFISTLVNSEVAVTTTANLALATMHVMSGSAAYTVTLPAASGNAGKFVGGRITSTNLITLKGNGSELIDGVNTHLLILGEAFFVMCDGTSWFKIGGKSVAMSCRLRMNAAQSLAGDGAVHTLTLDTTVSDPSGLMATLGSNGITIKRPGTYSISGTIILGPSTTTGNSLLQGLVQKGGSTILSVLGASTPPASIAYFTGAPLGAVPLVATDLITLAGFANVENVAVVTGVGNTALSVAEASPW